MADPKGGGAHADAVGPDTTPPPEATQHASGGAHAALEERPGYLWCDDQLRQPREGVVKLRTALAEAEKRRTTLMEGEERKCDGCKDPVAPFTLYYCEACLEPSEADSRVVHVQELQAKLAALRARCRDAAGIARVIDAMLAGGVSADDMAVSLVAHLAGEAGGDVDALTQVIRSVRRPDGSHVLDDSDDAELLADSLSVWLAGK